ncbi:MAG: hypothetical protein Q4E76_06920 [Tissierellia bacterium]|nr:hypothetical protein [Tissierellia bacterium]
MQVKNYLELQQALEAGEETIELVNSINAVNGIGLKPGQKLVGSGEGILLSFIHGDGVALSANNELKNLALQTAPGRRAIYIDSALEDLGEIQLQDLTVTGMVQLLTRAPNKTLSLKLENLDIVSADARSYPERPMKYGVNVYQGALTVYNFNPQEGSEITLRGENISVGRPLAPVLGSGIFISGFGDDAGPVTVERLTTGEVHSNGMIPTGQPNLITGAIFVVYGVHAKEIISQGPTTTYGTNDMVLDVWGQVDQWTVKGKVTSYGSSGIGFVNFGVVKNFHAQAPIETYGLGARGFNQYDGTIENARFTRIKTAGDGSIGMQFSKPVGTITIEEAVTTQGATGETLVKGVLKELQAHAISVLEGGSIRQLNLLGDLHVQGEDVAAYHISGGTVEKLNLKGKITVDSEKSQAVVLEDGGTSDLTDLKKYLN